MSLIDDATLLKMAEAELLCEAKKAAVRHSVIGISGWKPCPKPNKLFLTNTILQTVASNKILSKKQEEKKGKKPKSNERKLLLKNKGTSQTNFIFKKPDKKKESKCNSTNHDSDKNIFLSKFKRNYKQIVKNNESGKVKKYKNNN